MNAVGAISVARHADCVLVVVMYIADCLSNFIGRCLHYNQIVRVSLRAIWGAILSDQQSATRHDPFQIRPFYRRRKGHLLRRSAWRDDEDGPPWGISRKVNIAVVRSS